jgi:hypothetical protein
MHSLENYSINSQAFLLLMTQFKSTKIRQSRLLRRSLDEIKSSLISA